MKKYFPFYFLLIILLIQNLTLVKATPIFSNGFEEGDFSAWSGLSTSGTAPIVQDTTKYAGNYAEKCAVSVWGQSGWSYKSFTTDTTLYAQSMIRFDSTQGSGSRPFCFIHISQNSWGNEIIGAGINVVSEVIKWCVAYYDGSTIQIVSSATTAVINTWYRLEIKLVSNAGAGEVRVYVDNVELVDLAVTGLTNNGRPPYYIRSGVWQVSGTAKTATNIYMDNVILDTSYIGLGVKNIEETVTGAITIGKINTKQMGISRGSTGSVIMGKVSGFNKGFNYVIVTNLIFNSSTVEQFGKTFMLTALISFNSSTSRLISMLEIISRNIDINALGQKISIIKPIFIEENRGNLFYPVIIILLIVFIFILLSRRG